LPALYPELFQTVNYPLRPSWSCFRIADRSWLRHNGADYYLCFKRGKDGNR